MNILQRLTSKLSFRLYLFLLIVLFLAGIAALQLVYVNYLQNQITQEIEQRSTFISTAAVKHLSEEFRDIIVAPVDPNTVHENPTVVEKDVQFVMVGQQSNTEVQELIKVPPENLPNELRKIVEERKINGQVTSTVSATTMTTFRNEDINSWIARIDRGEPLVEFKADDNKIRIAVPRLNNPSSVQRHIVEYENNQSAIQEHLRWLSIFIILVTLAGILFAIWLSHHISRPMHALASGFKQLESGNIGAEIPTNGIKDVKELLERFNKMSARLLHLNKVTHQLEQQKQLAELGEMFRGLAHTLRNPINTIGLAIEEMSQPNVDEQERKALAEQTRSKITHLDKTIKMMLSMTEQDVDRSQSIDINEVIQDVILEMSMHSSTIIHFNPEQSLMTNGSNSEIRTLVHTIIANALEANVENLPIDVKARQEQQLISIQVADQGTGLSPEIKDQLFQPHITSKAEGAGMGLYIAQRICQSHYNGDIRLENRVPKGCLCTITLEQREGMNHEQN